ncbi:hypothetical protein KVR01_007324 [Diaporthe batatas]|uniref:uncharacterized protein n=1 Tax=Diaporthe batatas TaxID=748121 RepID=UPI001D04C3D6|nr:uncharacterized protein KVR01_007324 [Diaporthe batatas]KAG8162846.1 hypothetical protein KVR01_007324 [Diaporthe batatas]
MTLGLLNDPQHAAYFFITIFLMPFAVLAVLLRFLAVRRSSMHHQSEDWLALASLFLYLVFDGVTLAVDIIGEGRDISGLIKDPEDLMPVRKLMYSALWAYVWQQLFAKLSIMCLYYRLFHVNHRFRLCIYALVIYHIAWVIIVSVMLSLFCQPLGKFFDPLVPGQCNGEITFVAVTETINSFGDFLLVALAMYMVRILHLSKVNKWRLRILFGSGALAGIIGFLKIGLSFNRSWSFNEASLYVFTMVAIWSNVQAAVCIVCCCAPVYKPVLPGSSFWSRFTSKASFGYLKRGQYHPHGSNTSPSTSSTKPREPSCEHEEQGWLARNEGSSQGLVWAEPKGCQCNGISAPGVVYPLEVIKVQRDIEVLR